MSVREELLNQFILTLLETLHAKGHSTQLGDLVLGIAQRQMTQQTFNPTTPVIYNLSGQKLATPKKGLNIVDGKKVVIR